MHAPSMATAWPEIDRVIDQRDERGHTGDLPGRERLLERDVNERSESNNRRKRPSWHLIWAVGRGAIRTPDERGQRDHRIVEDEARPGQQNESIKRDSETKD